MKKVRFLSTTMDDSDCHSPRPFIRKDLGAVSASKHVGYQQNTSLDLDPLTLYETSNGIPYSVINKSEVDKPNWSCKENVNIQPLDQLELSFLDSSYIEPRKPMISKTTAFQPFIKSSSLDNDYGSHQNILPRPALKVIENNKPNFPPNTMAKDDSFFIRRDNIDKVLPLTASNLNKDLARLKITKENDVIAKKTEIINNLSAPTYPMDHMYSEQRNQFVANKDFCKCHHCQPAVQKHPETLQAMHNLGLAPPYSYAPVLQRGRPNSNLPAYEQMNCHSNCPGPNVPPPINPACHCNHSVQPQQNAIDLKTRAIEKYEQSRQDNCTEIEKTTAVSKEKREPTVSDLFKIIKLQNEQLQLLQEKVDRFITTSNQTKNLPVQNYVSEQLTVETVENDHKISIGVMTSFEIRTSTVFNKEVGKTQNVQVNNQSQVLQENKQPVMLNFLEGITPVKSLQSKEVNVSNSMYESDSSNDKSPNTGDKTLNEISLYNVQVDNATTPLLSPEQTLYLDVRDYSDSDSTSDEQSGVGWTYYNKVMTHVNGMLHDSDLPSSASALYTNTRRQCLQLADQRMQIIDKTNVSVMKRVKFGDDLQHLTAQAATDTSMKMNQLAAKYLKNGRQSQRPPLPSNNTDISFATRKYMERHQIIQGVTPPLQRAQSPDAMPRFLDITALKKQPKFL